MFSIAISPNQVSVNGLNQILSCGQIVNLRRLEPYWLSTVFSWQAPINSSVVEWHFNRRYFHGVIQIWSTLLSASEIYPQIDILFMNS